jgi:hypothetical protein
MKRSLVTLILLTCISAALLGCSPEVNNSQVESNPQNSSNAVPQNSQADEITRQAMGAQMLMEQQRINSGVGPTVGGGFN